MMLIRCRRAVSLTSAISELFHVTGLFFQQPGNLFVKRVSIWLYLKKQSSPRKGMSLCNSRGWTVTYVSALERGSFESSTSE